MKKFFLFAGAAIVALGALFTSCEKPNNTEPEGDTPVVSISADKNFNSENSAVLTLTLSAKSSQDVVVKLEKADVQDGKKNVAATFAKTVTIKAGSLTETVDVKAETYGMTEGAYQAAIKIASATGAEVSENAVAYINLEFAALPEVNLAADLYFATDKTAKLTVSVSKASDKDIVVNLEDGADNKAVVAYEKKVTIPAGETSKNVTVTVEIPEDLATGSYPVEIKVASLENAVAGDVKAVTITLSYPFATDITVDGVFDDWNVSSTVTYNLADGALYTAMKTMKLAANSKYVYMYLEFPKPETNMIYNIYIDPDGNTSTGARVEAIDNNIKYPPFKLEDMGIGWYLGDGFFLTYNEDGSITFSDLTSTGLYEYIGEDGKGIFSKLDSKTGTVDGTVWFSQGAVDGDVCRAEIQFQRKFFKMTGDKARFAFKSMGADWVVNGLLPQGPATTGTVDGKDTQVNGHVEMALINMPLYVE